MTHRHTTTLSALFSSLRSALQITLAITLLSVTSACSHLGKVEAWEKGALAKSEMRLDKDKLALKNADHIYTSREGASGTGSVGGGGCGCN